MSTFVEKVVSMNVHNLLLTILQKNRITIDDKVAELSETTGLVREDNWSPLLFSILPECFSDQVEASRKCVEVVLYANNLVICGPSRFQVQQVLTRFDAAVTDLGLIVSLRRNKTESMQFRKGGRIAATHTYTSLNCLSSMQTGLRSCPRTGEVSLYTSPKNARRKSWPHKRSDRLITCPS